MLTRRNSQLVLSSISSSVKENNKNCFKRLQRGYSNSFQNLTQELLHLGSSLMCFAVILHLVERFLGPHTSDYLYKTYTRVMHQSANDYIGYCYQYTKKI